MGSGRVCRSSGIGTLLLDRAGWDQTHPASIVWPISIKSPNRRSGSMVRRNNAILFILHAIMALHILLYFPAVLEFFFGTRLCADQFFKIFTLFLPGLVF